MVEMTDDLFAMQIQELQPGRNVPFPLFIYFPNSDRYVIASIPNAEFTQNAIDRIKSRLNTVWVPRKYLADYVRYKNDSDIPAPEVAPAPPKAAKESLLHKEKKAAENLAREFQLAYTDDTLAFVGRREAFLELSRQALESIVRIESTDPSEKKRGLLKCNHISYEILLLASASNDLLREILTIRSFKEDLDHSVVVSAVAAMLAMGLGIVEKKDLEVLTIAGFLHDLGLSRIPIAVQSKPLSELEDAELSSYAEHVNHSLDLLEEGGFRLDAEVLELIHCHHEHFDGSGFSRGISGADFSDLAQVLSLANHWDELTCGKVDGQLKSPMEAFEVLLSDTRPGEPQRWSPELIIELRQVFQSSIS